MGIKGNEDRVDVMEITSELIKKLRDKTGAGMMDCKRALEATGGNMDEAVEYLRKKGAAVAQKRADRAAKEGAIVTRIADNGKLGVMVEVNCETDFVGRSDDFVGFANEVAATIEQHKPANVEELLLLSSSSGKKISELMNDLLSKVGEKVDVRRFITFLSPSGVVSSYTHLGAKIGVLVELTGEGDAMAGRDVAMQIAAMNPMVITREQVDKAILDREIDIYKSQAANEGKPAHIAEKIANGRLEKFYQEVCLLEQTFVKESSKTVKEYLQGASKAGTPLVVKRFHRFHLGEETT